MSDGRTIMVICPECNERIEIDPVAKNGRIVELERELAEARRRIAEYERKERRQLFETCPDDCQINPPCKATHECTKFNAATNREVTRDLDTCPNCGSTNIGLVRDE
jgi:hypothetical protein